MQSAHGPFRRRDTLQLERVWGAVRVPALTAIYPLEFPVSPRARDGFITLMHILA